jgi:hypothetical protein
VHESSARMAAIDTNVPQWDIYGLFQHLVYGEIPPLAPELGVADAQIGAPEARLKLPRLGDAWAGMKTCARHPPWP